MLCDQGYTYLPIHTEADLISNLRAQLEMLNNYKFSDDEWKRFFNESVANANKDHVAKTRKIQEDYVQVLKRDDGMSKNIMLIEKTMFIITTCRSLTSTWLEPTRVRSMITDTM